MDINENISIKDTDAKKRYKGTLSVWGDEEKANHLIDCALEIENQITKYCNLKPEEINDKSIEKIIEELKNYNI